ncbi:hypothetical protein [Lyngbya sp. PCC 8106]|uniref:hypothetical protein n=1 Tax=Lyngbya sp. (strain PCC 8106) TaxID=313612 RepID=UPI0000EAB651|nr:hypothetical protein [Lyngbya sp. PCC 8106]EAW36042.1 hypothetical protein L8106_22641 [Lyngbya sp. PCC 8106]
MVKYVVNQLDQDIHKEIGDYDIWNVEGKLEVNNERENSVVLSANYNQESKSWQVSQSNIQEEDFNFFLELNSKLEKEREKRLESQRELQQKPKRTKNYDLEL